MAVRSRSGPPLSRRSLLIGGAALGVTFAISGCRRSPEAGSATVNVYNWSDYIAPDTLRRFQAETGISVVYDVYDSNELLEAKLGLGKTGYDLVFPSVMPNFARQVAAGKYLRLDRRQIPNWSRVDPKVLGQLDAVDPGNAHGLPYLMAATGIGYNRRVIEPLVPAADRNSLRLLFDPRLLQSLKRPGVTVLDSAIEVLPAALSFSGRDPRSLSEEDLALAGQVVSRARPFYRYIHSSSYINDLANGEISVAQGWIGDLVQARDRAKEAKNGVEIDIVIPREGAPFNVDMMAIPADAPHPENAHRLINFLLSPQVIGSISNAVGYANAVPESRRFMKPEISNDAAIYPPPSTSLYVPPLPSSEYERRRNRLWTRIKSGT